MVSHAVWGQSWTRKGLEPVAGVFVFELPGLPVFREVNSAAVGIPKLAKVGREGLQEPEALGYWVSKGETLVRCLAHSACCVWTTLLVLAVISAAAAAAVEQSILQETCAYLLFAHNPACDRLPHFLGG